MYLSQFNFTVIYKKGTSHVNADTLSRLPLPETIPINKDTDLEDVLVLAAKMDSFSAVDHSIALDHLPSLKEAQETDSYCKKMRQEINGKKKIGRKFIVNEDDILCRIIESDIGRKILPVIPNQLIHFAIGLAHDPPEAGHQGILRTTMRISQKYYSPFIAKAVENYVSTCPLCQRKKTPSKKAHSSLGKLPTSRTPFEIISCDLIGPLNTTSSGKKHVVVVVDVATRYLETCAVRTTTTEWTLKVLLDQVFFRHGIPKILISDRGTNFTSEAFKKTMESFKIKHHMTTAFNPACNGITERANKTLGIALAMYCHSYPTNWDKLLPRITFGLNTAVNDITKYTPFQLLYWRNPLSSLDTFIGYQSSDSKEYLIKDLNQLYKIMTQVEQRIKDSQDKNKRIHEQKFATPDFKIGDLVLLRKPIYNSSLPRKFQLIFRGPYKIISQLKDTPSSFIIFDEKTKKKEAANSRNLRQFRERKIEGDYSSINPVGEASKTHKINDFDDQESTPDIEISIPVGKTGVRMAAPVQNESDLPDDDYYDAETGGGEEEEEEERRYPNRERKQVQLYQARR